MVGAAAGTHHEPTSTVSVRLVGGAGLPPERLLAFHVTVDRDYAAALRVLPAALLTPPPIRFVGA